ncbi:hypothetical protein Tco_0955494 [Tanacetum coccineum]|uniref:Uncharacterized protein n=1 Tax=Tanacetum coccineum TaxID=301880 RepID=A0ABQ5E7H7_9ASTR
MCLADASQHVPFDEIKVDKSLHFVENWLRIVTMNKEVKMVAGISGGVKVIWADARVFRTSDNVVYAAMPTLLWAGKVVSSKDLLWKVSGIQSCNYELTWGDGDYFDDK